MRCITKTAEFPASLIIEGRQFPTLAIFTPAAWPDVARIFSDPAETAVIIERRDDGTEIEHRGFSRLRSLSPTTIATGAPEIMVWLDYAGPMNEETKEEGAK